MKEYKFIGRLYPDRIIPGNGYDNIRNKIQNIVGTSLSPRVELTVRILDSRQDWIDEWYTAAKGAEKNDDIFIKFCKDVTFICKLDAEHPEEIACAAPRRGDKYDKHTGIAVAYAKLCRRPIPDYI